MSSNECSGFLSHQQEGYYCRLMEKLIQIFQERLLAFYKNQQIDERKFQKRILKLSYVLEQCEKHKQLEPQFSLHFDELTVFLRAKYIAATGKSVNLASAVSNLSQSSRASLIGSERPRERDGSAAGGAVITDARSSQVPDQAGRENWSRVPPGQIPKQDQRAARARSAEAGRRRPRGDVDKRKVTSGILGYSYRAAAHNRGQSNKSYSSHHSQASPAPRDAAIKNNAQRGLNLNKSLEESADEKASADQAAVRHLKTSDDDLYHEMPALSPSCERITEADQEDCSLIIGEKQKASSPDYQTKNRVKISNGFRSQREDNERRKKKKDQLPKAQAPLTQTFSLQEPAQLSQIYLHKPINFNQMNQNVQQLEPSLLMQSLSRLQPVVIPEKLGQNGNTIMMDAELVPPVSGAGIEMRLSRPRPSTQQNLGKILPRNKQHLAKRVAGQVPIEPTETRTSKSKLPVRVATATSRRERQRLTASNPKAWVGSSWAAGASNAGPLLDAGRKSGQREQAAALKKILHKANRQQLLRNQQFLDEHTPSLYHANPYRNEKASAFDPPKQPSTRTRILKPQSPPNEKRAFLQRRNPSSRRPNPRNNGHGASKHLEYSAHSTRQPTRAANTGQPALSNAYGYFSSIPTTSQGFESQEARESEVLQPSLAAKHAAKSSRSDYVGLDQGSSGVRHVSMQQKRLSRIQQLQAYQEHTDQEEADQEEKVTATEGVGYTMSDGGMLEEPYSGEGGGSAQLSEEGNGVEVNNNIIENDTINQETQPVQDEAVGDKKPQSREAEEGVKADTLKAKTKNTQSTLAPTQNRQPQLTQCLDSRKFFGEAKTGGTLGIAKEKHVDDDHTSEQLTERNQVTKQRITSLDVVETPKDTIASQNRPSDAATTIERPPTKKRHGHQPSQVGSRGIGAEEARLQSMENNSRPATSDLQDFSFAEGALTKVEGDVQQ